jgi:hypothetical protein
VTPAGPIPRPALALGLAGVLPFAALALQVATNWPLPARFTGPALLALTFYAAAILAFMGGVQWGLAVARPSAGFRAYAVSVLPAFAACIGLWLQPRDGLLVMSAAFALLVFYDLWTVARGEAPSWYGRLRIGLTSAVLACLLAAAQLGPF